MIRYLYVSTVFLQWILVHIFIFWYNENMIYSQNEEELISIGQKLGRLLNSGDIIVLSGDLGAGKTTLTKGIAKGLDISQMIKSPTYTIVRE